MLIEDEFDLPDIVSKNNLKFSESSRKRTQVANLQLKAFKQGKILPLKASKVNLPKISERKHSMDENLLSHRDLKLKTSNRNRSKKQRHNDRVSSLETLSTPKTIALRPQIVEKARRKRIRELTLKHSASEERTSESSRLTRTMKLAR